MHTVELRLMYVLKNTFRNVPMLVPFRKNDHEVYGIWQHGLRGKRSHWRPVSFASTRKSRGMKRNPIMPSGTTSQTHWLCNMGSKDKKDFAMWWQFNQGICWHNVLGHEIIATKLHVWGEIASTPLHVCTFYICSLCVTIQLWMGSVSVMF